MTGYLNTTDHTMHVVYIDDSFAVIDLQRNANTLEWTWVTLAPQAWNDGNRSYSALTSWTTGNGVVQHVAFKANDEWAYEAFYESFGLFGGPPAWYLVQLWEDGETAGNQQYYPAMASYVWQADNTEHLIFTGMGDGDPNIVTELWQRLGGGNDWNQTSFNSDATGNLLFI